MEPVKGGTLANIPSEAETLLRSVHPYWTPAEWALRFVQSLPEAEVCLSGMNTVEQVKTNIYPFEPLSEDEFNLLQKTAAIIRGKTAIDCTGCAYCVSHCPKQIPIPQYIKLYNELTRYLGDDWKIIPTNKQFASSYAGASDCVSCRSCEKHCPQDLGIADHMKTIAECFR